MVVWEYVGGVGVGVDAEGKGSVGGGVWNCVAIIG